MTVKTLTLKVEEKKINIVLIITFEGGDRQSRLQQLAYNIALRRTREFYCWIFFSFTFSYSIFILRNYRSKRYSAFRNDCIHWLNITFFYRFNGV